VSNSNQDVNSLFTGLPPGYSYRLDKTFTYSNGYASYRVILITPEGKEIPLVGENDSPISFPNAPGSVYSLRSVCDTLIKMEIGSGEAYYYHVHGYGERTGEYLNACKEDLLLSDITVTGDLSDFNDGWTQIDGGFNQNEIFIKPESPFHYIAAFQVRADNDTTLEYRYTFNKRPTIDNVMTAQLIYNIQKDFRLGKYTESYFCWECGNKVMNWIDTDGGLREKWDCLKEKYCGCKKYV